MKLAALLFTCLPVACAGPMLVRRQYRRVWLLGQFTSFFQRLSQTAAGACGSPGALVRHAAGADDGFWLPAAFAALAENAGAPEAAWREALCGGAEWNRLSAAEQGLLLSFGAAFAGASRREFEAVCAAYARQCGELREAAAQKLRKDEKLWLSLPSLLAALLFIILI